MTQALGKALREAELKIRESGVVVFNRVDYILDDLTLEELNSLHANLKESSRKLRKPLKNLSEKENNRRRFLSKLRTTQAKVVSSKYREKQEIEL